MDEIIVVGGGPAGLTAALYAARAGQKVRVLEKDNPGGQIQFAHRVENYPGMPGMSGAAFCETLVEQVEALGVTVDIEEVLKIRRKGEDYIVTTDCGDKCCKAVILATGAAHRMLGLAGEEALCGLGVSYCAVCDGAFYEGKDVAVVGGGDTALQDVLFLSAICRHVTLIHRRDTFRGEMRLQEQVKALPNVTLKLSATVQKLLETNGELSGIVLSGKDGSTEILPLDGLFIAVGQEPGTKPFASLVSLSEGGYFAVDEACKTALPGLFTAGDCREKAVRQLTTAVGDGAAAGLAAAAYLQNL